MKTLSDRLVKGRRIGAGDLGTGLALEALVDDARTLGPEAFEQRYGSGFLMVTAARVDGRRGESTTHLLLGDDDPSAQTADLGLAVYPLRPRQQSPSDLVTLGRESRHDLVIPDASVSRFHAFAKRGPDGRFLLQDAESTNGTSVNGRSVPSRETGPAEPLTPGDTVRLGQVEFTFTDANGLRGFVLKALA
jgi:pSer/pThr/pTyr-binding forkhead associated (FHA) protein